MNKRKLKAIHIHTDYKFINNSYFFDGDLFENETIIFQNNEAFSGHFKHKIILLNNTIKDINKAIRICENSDLVVLYDLTPIKARIALSLPKEIKIAWRFFGYELYGKRRDVFLSNKSLKFNIKTKKSLKQYLLFPVKQVYLLVKFKRHPKCLFFKAIARINYMFVLSREEYKLLKNYWPDLPELIQLPHRYFDESLTLPSLKSKMKHEKPVIVLGNNRSSYNNHFDLIEMIDKTQFKQNYQFSILFNYGPEGDYAKAVRESIKGKPYYNLIDEFMPPEEFEDFYRNISALVINGYRQMAGANIFMAIQNGVKVYLNEKNIFTQWLKNEGLTIFSINDFENDIEKGNVQMDMETAERNLEQLKAFSIKYTKEAFQKKLYEKILKIDR